MKTLVFPPRRGLRPLPLALCAMVSALLVRLTQIQYFGVDVPFMDQWDGELERLYYHYLDGTLGLGDFFLPANEHRIFYTRVMNLIIFIARGNIMDNMLVMRFQALISILPLGILSYALNRDAARYFSTALLTAIWMLPLSGENLFWAYQSQVYFAITFACLGLYFASKTRQRVSLITLSCVLGVASMASAAFTAVAAAVACVARWWVDRDRGHLIRAGFYTALSYILSLAVVHNPGHAIYRATTLGQWFTSFLAYISWPELSLLKSGLAVWVVTAGFVIAYGVKSLKPSFEQWLGMLLMTWLGIFNVVGAASRVGTVANRYHDYMILGFAGAILLTARYVSIKKYGLFVGLFQLALLIPLVLFSQDTQYFNRVWRDRKLVFRQDVREALQALPLGDGAALTIIKRHPGLGYPDDEVLVRILRDPKAAQALKTLR